MRVSLPIVDIPFYIIFQLTITNAAKRDSREIRERNHESNVENNVIVNLLIVSFDQIYTNIETRSKDNPYTTSREI